MPYPAPLRPPARSAAPAARLPRVLVLAGSTAGAGTSTTAAILAATAAALGQPVQLADDPAAAAPPDALLVVDAGSRLADAQAALARHPGAALLVVTGPTPPALAAAFALLKATGAPHAEALLVGADAAEAALAAARLDEGARQFLGRPLRLAAAVPEDPSLAVALAAGMPVHDAAAGSPAAAALHALALRALPAHLVPARVVPAPASPAPALA